MAITTAKKSLDYAPGDIVSFRVAASTTIPEGAIVSVNAAGYAVNGTDAANDVFVGIADETVTNGITAGEKRIKVRRTGVYTFKYNGTATVADINTLVYITDNETVDVAGDLTNDVLVGRIVDFLSASLVRVDIRDRV